MIVEKKHLDVESAFYYLYTSDLYRNLTEKDSSLWQQSTLSLYESLKKEKLSANKTQEHNSKITLFQAFCLEQYKKQHNISATDSLYIFLSYDVFKYIESVYQTLHTQSEYYIIAEIDKYIKRKKEEE
ncbi:DUF3791 domain-containing protein [Paludibacter sp. 221]|uniref:DUF3791 domain-containing protein n=1 Tax=Paludibacter sp. 221 TaxID=2302939 RepID=UPI0013D77FE9|nr:DUF3791 domain-containing protein [Paludibacter sp. 221]